jgi:hypothetical protein
MTAKKSTKQSTAKAGEGKGNRYSYCTLREVPPRVFDPSVPPGRASLIRKNAEKWVNGTVLHYYFFTKPSGWTTKNTEKNVVREAFRLWKEVGIGLSFEEVHAPADAEIRIGFLRGDGAWSYIGRYVLNIGTDERTMNFGWDLTRPGEIDTAVHEIGHTLGFPHEHQNPNAGIAWNEEAVYTALAAPPNSWSRQKTFNNIIRKIDPDEVQGSNWDPDSIMHYPFEAGLIDEPAKYRDGLEPAPGLSERDKQWVKTFYAPLDESSYPKLEVLRSQALTLNPGEQANFVIEPPSTGKYRIGTFGESDTVMVLFEDEGGNLRYLSGDDDSGTDFNARIEYKLFKDRRYVLRIRLYYADRLGRTAVMMW